MPGNRRIQNHLYVFLPRHIRELLGISSRQLRYWKQTGFFVPLKVKQQLRYSFEDFCLLTCVKNMRSHGISVQKMRGHQVPRLLKLYREARKDYATQDLGFFLRGEEPVIFAGKIFMDEVEGLTSPVLFGQLWEAVREIRIQTRLDTLESTAM